MANSHYSPRYYTRGSIEVWDFIRDQGLDYHLGCAIKYICRAGYKDSKVDDLKKALHYIENELQHALSESKLERSGRTIPKLIRDRIESEYEDDAEAFDR